MWRRCRFPRHLSSFSLSAGNAGHIQYQQGQYSKDKTGRQSTHEGSRMKLLQWLRAILTRDLRATGLSAPKDGAARDAAHMDHYT
jgi:hypothetical protein